MLTGLERMSVMVKGSGTDYLSVTLTLSVQQLELIQYSFVLMLDTLLVIIGPKTYGFIWLVYIGKFCRYLPNKKRSQVTRKEKNTYSVVEHTIHDI